MVVTPLAPTFESNTPGKVTNTMSQLVHRLGLTALAAASFVLAACSDSSSAVGSEVVGASTYRIGGTVAGLPTGGQVSLLNNGGDAIAVAQNGAFTFATRAVTGAAYAVSVGTQPADTSCTVASGTGAVASTDITTVAVTCVPTFAVGGRVSGLVDGATVTVSGGDAGTFTASANGDFTLPTRVTGNGPYALTVTAQPAGQICSVKEGSAATASTPASTPLVSCVFSAQYAYVLNHNSNTISTLSIDTLTGAITSAGSAAPAGDGPDAIATNGLGTLAVVANNVGKTLSVYRINGTNGALTALASPVATQSLHPRSVAISGNLIFVAVGDYLGVNKLLTYRVNTTAPSVTLTDTRDLPTGGIATSVDVNGEGTLVMATVAGANTLSMFSINFTTSGLVEAAGSPVIPGTNPRAARFSPSGNLALVANRGGDVAVYAVSATGGLTAKAGSPYPTGGTSPSAMAIDATGTLVYVTNADSNNLSSFALDSAVGSLTPVTGSPFAVGANPQSVSVDRGSLLVFVGNRGDGTVSVLRAGAANVLTPVTGSPITVGSEPSGISFGP